MRIFSFGLLMIAVLSNAQADWLTTDDSNLPSYTYDYRSGNSYTTSSLGDSTYVSGFNYNTGSTWSTTIDSAGNMNGMDSNYNPWSYNSTSGVYMNYGTGKMCTGSGYTRTCF